MRSILFQHRTPRSLALRCLVGAVCLAVLFGVAGCTRTVIGGYEVSPDKRYCVYGRIYGAYGRSFLDNTTKTARISIVTVAPNETLLFRKEYRIRGSDVSWDGTWDQQHNLTVVFFEYPPGVNRYDLNQKGSPTNFLRAVKFRFDSKAQTFAEESTK